MSDRLKLGSQGKSELAQSSLEKETKAVSTKKVAETTNPTEEIIVAENTETTPVVADPKDFGPLEGGNNILAAWQGLYWLFGARAESFEITPEGVFVVGLTVNEPYDVDKIVHDLCVRGDKTVERRLDLVPAYFYINGSDPTLFTDSNAMTLFMAQYFRGAGDTAGRSPEYVKAAISAYKKMHGLVAKRGRPSRTIKIEALGDIDESVLANVDVTELEKLRETLERALASR